MTLKLHCDQCGKNFTVEVFAQWHGSEPDPIGQIVLDQHKRYDCPDAKDLPWPFNRPKPEDA